MNIQIVKTRLAKYLGDNQLRFDVIFANLLYNNEYSISKIMLITGRTITNIRQSLREELSERDYAAMYYASNDNRDDEWLDLGKDFVRSLPQTEEKDVEEYASFIVECMRWGDTI